MFSLLEARKSRHQTQIDRNIWQLAWPMILANISVPLLGFVDTAVIGHLPNSNFLAGTALGSLLITVLFWLLGFLRMSTTGLVAQTAGRGDRLESNRYLAQGIGIALLLAFVILMLQGYLFALLPYLTGHDAQVQMSLEYARMYFDIRIWITPVSLCNLVLTGYLIGQGQTKRVLTAVIVCNLVNLFADILFVPVMGLGVEGVAYATVLAELTQFVLLAMVIVPQAQISKWQKSWFTHNLRQAFKLNSTLFFRSALLQLCLSFMTLYASNYGAQAIAINAILMQFFLFISFAMDGIAFALESIVGNYYGASQTWKAKLNIRRGFVMAFKFSLVYSLVYVFCYDWIVMLLTDISDLRVALQQYWLVVICLPLVSFASFIYDGIFVGLAWVKQMRNSMLHAAVVYFLAVWLTLSLNNLGLWMAFLSFMLARGASQYFYLKKF